MFQSLTYMHLSVSPVTPVQDPNGGSQGASMEEIFSAAQDPDLEDYCWRLSQAPKATQRDRKNQPKTFEELRELLNREIAWHPLAKLGLVKDTRDSHQKIIKWIREQDGLNELSMENGVMEAMARLRKNRSWKWSTTMKNMASFQGALKHYGIELQNSQWKMAVRGVAIKAREERPKQARPATTDTIQRVVEQETDLQLAAAIAMSWLTCARIGCISQLRKEDITIGEQNRMAVTFRRGKAVRSRGPYTVHTKLPPQWADLIRSQLQRPQPFTTTSAKVRRALRRVDKRLEQRSLRRGALQTLAEAGVPEEELLNFSGHTTLGMLRRYLDWGRVNQAKAQRQAQNADALQPHQGL
jgi:Arc/MetJ-type ribon-helix-helix transcriptional regulator